MPVKFKVQSLLWLDDRVDIAFFGDRKSATAFKDATKLCWPLYLFRVVGCKRGETNLERVKPERLTGTSRTDKRKKPRGAPAKRRGSRKKRAAHL